MFELKKILFVINLGRVIGCVAGTLMALSNIDAEME